MSDTQLLNQADKAFASNQEQRGLLLLREYNHSNTTDAASWHRQALIEEQIGEFGRAGEAHFRCIQIAPTNAMAYLYAGYWLQQKKRQLAAASLYSMAFDIDASVLSLWQHESMSGPTRMRSSEANTLLRAVLSEQHIKVCANIKGAERIGEAQWPKTSTCKVDFGQKDFAPDLFYIPGISKNSFHKTSDLDWANRLTKKIADIKHELTHAISMQIGKDSLRPYLDSGFSSHAGLGQLAGSKDWTAIDLYKNGELNLAVADLFPKTIRAMEEVPCYNLGQHPFEVFFSFLQAQQSIAPHFGQSNHALTIHLPIEIPQNCYLQVGNQQKSWKEGELIAFDDSFLHSAHNQSDEVRVVLIFSVWHPDLTEQERQAVRASFQARENFLRARNAQIQQLVC